MVFGKERLESVHDDTTQLSGNKEFVDLGVIEKGHSTQTFQTETHSQEEKDNSSHCIK